MKTTKLSAMVVAASLLAASAMATSIPVIGTTDTLYNLAMSGGSVGIGDKVFSGFSYTASGLTDFDPMNIQVTASIEGDVYYLTWGGSIALVSGGPAVADLLLGYTVTANAGQIMMIDQSYTGSAQPIGGAFLAIDESVYDGQTIVANSHLEVFDLSDPFAEVGDDLVVDPPNSNLRVTKDIGLGIVRGGFVTISEVRQSFHQKVADGGTTLSMLGLALAGVAMARRYLRG